LLAKTQANQPFGEGGLRWVDFIFLVLKMILWRISTDDFPETGQDAPRRKIFDLGIDQFVVGLRCSRSQSQKSTSRVTQRPGMSLLELLLVVAVLSTVVAISWPALRRPMSRNHIESAARQLQADILATRNRAMNAREVFVFIYRVDSDEYLICSLQSLRSTGLPSQFEMANRDGVEESEIERSLKQLPDGTWFLGQKDSAAADFPGQAERERSSKTTEKRTEIETAKSNWSAPLLFYPNGRMQSTNLILGSDQDYLIDVQVDGFGGRVKIRDLRRDLSEDSEQPTQSRSTADFTEED
jgi:prepilin-type N-terminal cleavage/methylation domain-containing protein